MSIGIRNIVPAYICLVGIPMLGLIGILDAGHDLHAPLAIGGAWDMQADYQSLAAGSCGVLAPSSGQRVLMISQSGKQLSLALDHMLGFGTVETSEANGQLHLPEFACGSGEASVYLHAAIQHSAGQEVMTGFLGLSRCSSCAPVPFRAVRRLEKQAER